MSPRDCRRRILANRGMRTRAGLDRQHPGRVDHTAAPDPSGVLVGDQIVGDHRDAEPRRMVAELVAPDTQAWAVEEFNHASCASQAVSYGLLSAHVLRDVCISGGESVAV